MSSLVRNLVAGMSAREKRLVVAMAVVMLGMAVFLIAFFVRSAIGELERENAMRAQSIRTVESEKEEYLRLQKERRQASTRGMSKPTPLRTLVDKVGKQVGVTVPDMKELPDQRHGDRWVEHAMELTMRGVGLEQITEFMEEVEDNRRRFPVSINKLQIRKRRRAENEFDVKMTISTYEQSAAPPDDSKKARSARKTGTAAGRRGEP